MIIKSFIIVMTIAVNYHPKDVVHLHYVNSLPDTYTKKTCDLLLQESYNDLIKININVIKAECVPDDAR